MQNIFENLLSPQAVKIYRTISKETVTAKDIGKKIKILPNAVYREIEKLKGLGLVFEVGKHPVRFKHKEPTESLGFITNLIKQNLFIGQQVLVEPLNLNFVQNRKELLDFTNKDTKGVKESLSIIVSGHEVPAETILVQKQAVDRGVRVRILIQDLSASGRERVRAWKKMGIEVRYLKYMQARILIFDGKIVYFTSYSESKNHEAVGMRFEYEPYARLMDELFEQKWLQARVV